MNDYDDDREWILVARYAFDDKLWLSLEEADKRGFVRVRVQVAYRPEETRTIRISQLRRALDKIESVQEKRGDAA